MWRSDLKPNPNHTNQSKPSVPMTKKQRKNKKTNWHCTTNPNGKIDEYFQCKDKQCSCNSK